MKYKFTKKELKKLLEKYTQVQILKKYSMKRYEFSKMLIRYNLLNKKGVWVSKTTKEFNALSNRAFIKLFRNTRRKGDIAKEYNISYSTVYLRAKKLGI